MDNGHAEAGSRLAAQEDGSILDDRNYQEWRNHEYSEDQSHKEQDVPGDAHAGENPAGDSGSRGFWWRRWVLQRFMISFVLHIGGI